MSAFRKLGAVAIASIAAFVASFVVSFLVTGVATALAQPAETGGIEARPDHGFAPPSDEEPPAPAAVNAPPGNAAAADTHHDPSKHFNFLGFDYRGKDEYGGKFGDGVMVDPHTGHAVAGEEQPMSAPFVLLVFNFLVVVALFVWKGRPAARKLATDRHETIKSALDEAAKLRNQAAAKLAEYGARLKDADIEIKNLVEGMRKDAESDKARILENAATQAAQLQKEAAQRIAAEIELARTSLTREVTIAATIATEKLLRERMMPGDQQKLVTTFIAEIGEIGDIDHHLAQPKERA